MHQFIITTTTHRNIHIRASSAGAARRMVMEAEMCPASAIRRTRAVDEHGFELYPETLGRRVVAVPGADVRITDFPGYRVSALRIPTRYEAFTKGRWRRVFTTRHTGLQYVTVDGLYVVVDLPKDFT